MVKLAILIPVLRRPQNIAPLVASIEATTKVDYKTLFITSPGDIEEIAELERQNQSYITMDRSYEGKGDYSRKINVGFKSMEAEWYFLGADDLRFHPRWFENAMMTHRKTGACVIGTNDLGNPQVLRGQHSTHSLILGEYATECGGTMDEPGKILHEQYSHNWVDRELVETARCRGAFAFSKDSVVQHNHPDWGLTQRDDVYDIGKKYFNKDQELFNKRERLWR